MTTNIIATLKMTKCVITTWSIATVQLQHSQLQQLKLQQISQLQHRSEVRGAHYFKVENLQLGVDVLQVCCNWKSKCCYSKGGRFDVYIDEVDEVADTYLSALQQMCDDTNLSGMSAEEIVDLVRSYEAMEADRLRAERDEIQDVQSNFMQVYSEFNPDDGSPNLESVLAWMRHGVEDSQTAASAVQPDGAKDPKPTTARLSLLDKNKTKSGGELMRLFMDQQSLLVRESDSGDKQLAATLELILKGVVSLQNSGITSDAVSKQRDQIFRNPQVLKFPGLTSPRPPSTPSCLPPPVDVNGACQRLIPRVLEVC